MIVRTIAEAESARARWDRIRWPRVDADLDFFLTVVSTRPGVVRPHALFNDSPTSALVARLETVQLATSVGYRTVYRPEVRALTVVHGGIVGADTDARADALVEELTEALARGEADMAHLPAVPVGSPLHRSASTRPGRLCRQHLGATAVHRRLSLPASFDEFLASRSKKTRESMKRYSNKLIRDHGDGLEVKVLMRPDDLELIITDAERVAAKTYQRGLGVAFGDTPEQRALTDLGLRRGWFRVWILYLDRTPVAFWPGFLYNGVFVIGTPGYDPAFGAYRPGQFILMRMVEDLCRDDSVSFVDYGFGDAEYKRRFSSDSWLECDVRIFAPTFKGIRINAITTAINGGGRLAQKALGGERAARIKKRWRGRLAGEGTHSESQSA